jgi:hypothetical protein
MGLGVRGNIWMPLRFSRLDGNFYRAIPWFDRLHDVGFRAEFVYLGLIDCHGDRAADRIERSRSGQG